MMHITLRNSMTRVATNTTITMRTLEVGGGEETSLELEEIGGGEGVEDAITKEDMFLST